MSSIQLEQIVLKNFRSFKDETIQFPDHGLICVRGMNRDTGGSSGSGKSSLLLGLAYALGYSHLDGTVLKTWGTEDSMKVQVRFRNAQGKVVQVSRGAKFELGVDGKAVTGSAAHKEKELEKLLGVVPKMLGTLTYRAQKKPSLFLSMTDSEKKKFLSEVLGLDRFEQIAKQAAEKANRLSIELGPLTDQAQRAGVAVPAERPTIQLQDISPWEIKLAQIEAEIPAIHTEYHSLVMEIARLQMRIDKESNELASECRAELAKLEDSGKLADLQAKLEILERAEQEKRIEHTAKYNKLLKERNNAAADLTRLKSSIPNRGALGAELTRLEAELTAVQENYCPTCERDWPKSNQKDFMVADLPKRIQEVKAKINSIYLIEEQVALATTNLEHQEAFVSEAVHHDPVPANIKAMKVQLTDAIARERQVKATIEIQRKSIVQDFDSRRQLLKTLSADGLAAISLQDSAARLMLRKDPLQREAESLRSYIAGAQQANQAATRQHEQQLLMYDQAVSNYDAVKAKLEQQIKDVAVHSEMAKLFGRDGFLGAIFDEILNEITEEVNKLLITLPNVAHITLKFESTRETQDGNLRKEIRPVIYSSGNAVPPEALSGGQYTAVELAVDRALAAVVGRRSGVQPGWLVLDEAFDGFDGVVKENCMEILKAVAQDNLVLVVDHGETFKAMFDDFIDLEFRDGYTKRAQ